MKIKAVIFDLDGTITEPYLDFDAVRKDMGIDVDAGPILEVMEKMTPQRREDVERILHFHEQRAVDESTLNPGARETLERLGELGIAVGILTRNIKSNAVAIAEKHGLKFDSIIGREDGPVKPDAFGVLELCKRFGVEPCETLMVGDYLFDLLCARAAGAVAVLLANQAGAEEFAEHGDFVIKKIDQVLEIIDDKADN